MKAVVQRVNSASVEINNKLYSSIKSGILVLFCVEKNDSEQNIDWFVKKILSLRIFEDSQQKMNLSVKDIQGEILVVSQFTLAADCKKGSRPSFDNAELPQRAEKLYEIFIQKLKMSDIPVQTGKFGAMMNVSLVNNGPVTFVLTQ